ncbi:RagB/SusD family nutrient uptake outer membrane protein [Hallella absiana]|uniref:RagB/SusD family nutrient uptake outer membrane protein n=1 Tax=Hallella absiana TaxID=2925336 RepID=UPI0021C87DA6|nr:RagB/SusD family nutrient uptake outer membrane protein [Hallella absiana]
MTIKNIILLGTLAVAALASCSDEMDYKEYSNYDKKYVFNNFDNTVSFVTNIYSYLDYDYGIVGEGMLASACDEAEYSWRSGSINNFTNGSLSANNAPSVFGFYGGIREANYFLANYKDCDFSEYQLNKDYANQMARFNRLPYEVRFLRAYFYFKLVSFYGDVPFYTDVISTDEANALGRTPAKDVLDFVVKECDEIAPHLPISYGTLENDAAAGETGRVGRLAAMALKARALLYKASPLFNTSGDKELWHQAALASKAVFDTCEDNDLFLGQYKNLWGTDNWQNDEVLLARRIGDLNWLETNNYPRGVENGKGDNCPTQTLVDAYDMKSTGKAWDDDNSGFDPAKPYNDRDPRLALTVAVNGEKNWPSYNGTPLETYYGGANGEPLTGATPTGYYLKKLLDGSVNISSVNSNTKRHSWVIFRLGEFYLDYAEAAFRYLGGADATSAELTMSPREALNQTRVRAEMPEFPEGMSNDTFWKDYEKERMVELAFEDHRYFDIRRWKEGPQHANITEMKITKNSDGSFSYKRQIVKRVWDDKLYFLPIPHSEMMKHTSPDFKQNPGY